LGVSVHHDFPAVDIALEPNSKFRVMSRPFEGSSPVL